MKLYPFIVVMGLLTPLTAAQAAEQAKCNDDTLKGHYTMAFQNTLVAYAGDIQLDGKKGQNNTFQGQAKYAGNGYDDPVAIQGDLVITQTPGTCHYTALETNVASTLPTPPTPTTFSVYADASGDSASFVTNSPVPTAGTIHRDAIKKNDHKN